MIGKMLGDRYELLEKIGEGGMAEVFKAKCHYLNRFVAIKILKDQFCNDKEFVGKFKREATSVASLGDNNIVNIYDVGSEEDIHYIVMEYVKGKTLKELIDEKGKLTNNEALGFSVQIASALVCAHKNNIVHRDIKPHNILLTEDNIVKVTDFGIAKASGSATITNSSKVMGSAHYFSPEQAKGSFVDFKTDIYSLGVVMYEMLTGKVPFDAESAVSVALKHIQDLPVAPKDINKDISDSLNELILKCLQKDPIRRYQSVKELLDDLTKIKNNEDVSINNMMENDMTRVLDTDLVNDKLKESSDLGDDELEEDDDEFEDIPKRKRSKKINNKLIIGAIAVLVIVVGSVAAFFSFSKSDAGSKVEVPNIVGMTKEDAEKALSEKNLKLTVAQKVKSDKKEGTIVESYPPSGTKVKKDSEVRVSISGGKVLTVPNLKGMDLQSAKDLINNSDLKVGDVSRRYSDSVPEGNIISQSLNTGEEVKEGTKIDLVVSRGENLEEKKRIQREAEQRRQRQLEAERKEREEAERQKRIKEENDKKPIKPDPEQPVKPDPVKPDPEQPDPEQPVKPDPVKPDPEQPVKPDPSTPTTGSGSGQSNSN